MLCVEAWTICLLEQKYSAVRCWILWRFDLFTGVILVWLPLWTRKWVFQVLCWSSLKFGDGRDNVAGNFHVQFDLNPIGNDQITTSELTAVRKDSDFFFSIMLMKTVLIIDNSTAPSSAICPVRNTLRFQRRRRASHWQNDFTGYLRKKCPSTFSPRLHENTKKHCSNTLLKRTASIRHCKKKLKNWKIEKIEKNWKKIEKNWKIEKIEKNWKKIEIFFFYYNC